MAAATIDDLVREIERSQAIRAALESKNQAEMERLTWMEQQLMEMNGLLGQAHDKAQEIKRRMKL